MAEMNLLKSTFTGTLGRVTGANWKGKPVVKAKIFSKAPPSNAQTQSVRAFEALNRLSSAIAKQGFSYMGLSQKNLLPHNAVAKFLKPLVKNHVFDFTRAGEVIPQDKSQVLLGFIYNRSTEQATVKIGLGDDFVPVTGTKTFINVFNQFGVSFFGELIDTQDYQKSFFMPYAPENQYNALIFMSEPAYKGVFLHGLDFKVGAGMQYSTDEQLTGDFWIDGKPIYIRSFTGTQSITAPNANNILLQEGVETLIESGGMWKAWNGGAGNNVNLAIGQPFFNSAAPNDLTWYSIIFLNTNNQVSFRAMAKGYSFTNLPYSVWIKYTKTS
jgi:hypothetical protein